MHLIVDAHEDLAWNALNFGRDYTRSTVDTRQAELKSETPRRNGNTLLGLPEYLQGQVAVVFGAMFVSPSRWASAWESQSYTSADEAYRMASRQLDYYHRLPIGMCSQFGCSALSLPRNITPTFVACSFDE